MIISLMTSILLSVGVAMFTPLPLLFKIITLAASLEEKTINIFDDHFHDSGSIHVDSARIKCWKKNLKRQLD